jgi:hypothetical protein
MTSQRASIPAPLDDADAIVVSHPTFAPTVPSVASSTRSFGMASVGLNAVAFVSEM